MQKVIVNNQQGNVFYTATYDQKSDRIYSSWYGNISIDEIKQGTEKYLEFIWQTNCLNLINDTSLLTASCDKTKKEWVTQEWMPRITEAGIKNLAFVVAANNFTSATSQLIEVKSTKSIPTNMEVFTDIVDAISWMRARIRKQEHVLLHSSKGLEAVYA